jgi:hypothetical protein
MTTNANGQRLDQPPRPSFDAFYAAVRNQPVYVILGVQGSGTNLLRSILVRTFNFAVIQDQSLVYNAGMNLGPTPSRSSVERHFDGIRSRLFPTPLVRKTRRRIKSNASMTGIEEHFDPARITCGADLARFVYAYAAFSRGSTLMAIKSDDMWETISHIDSVLPNRRIILLTRDFRDNLLSIANKDFGPIDPVVAASYVKERFSYYDAEYRRTPPEHRLHVSYEELLEAPDEFVARFREHFRLGAPGEAAMTVDKSRIRRHNKRKWAAALSTRDLAHCEAILWDELQAYGYETGTERPAPPGGTEWILARTRDALWRVPQKLRTTVGRLRK